MESGFPRINIKLIIFVTKLRRAGVISINGDGTRRDIPSQLLAGSKP